MGISPEVSEERCLYNHRGGTSALSQSARFLTFYQKFSHKHKLLFQLYSSWLQIHPLDQDGKIAT